MAPSTQQAVVVSDFAGGSHDIRGFVSVGDVPVIPPAAGEVLVKLLLRPVNPADYYRINGASGRIPVYPFTPGIEGVGVVEENGPGAHKFQPGQRVVALPWPTRSNPQLDPAKAAGTYQQYLAAPEDHLYAVPDEVDDVTAAQFAINPFTVIGMLERVAVPRGEWLLQTAAGSSLGKLVIALAKHRGIRTINVVRRSEQRQELLDLGADEVISSESEELAERVAEITGQKGAYAALDAVAGDALEQVALALRPGGTVLLYGRLAGPTAHVRVGDFLYGEKVLEGFAVPRWIVRKRAAGELDKEVAAAWDLIVQGVWRPSSGDIYPLAKAVDAIIASNQPARGGKVLIGN